MRYWTKKGNNMADSLDRAGVPETDSADGAADEVEYLTCPFCGTNDFDAIGLKGHLLRGWCDEFEAVELSDGRVI